jgi:hypothetical protein
MIPESSLFDQSTIMNIIDSDEVVQGYRALFALFDWSVVERWEAERAGRGHHGHPISAYLKAFLVRVNEGFIYTSRLREFLLKHPLLVIELGFHLKLDPASCYGFDSDKTLPTEVWLRARLRTLDQSLLQDLLGATVRDLQEAIPGLGETVAFDTKHIYAWVKENNPRAYVKDRYDKTHIAAGDPDCKLGVKRSTNQEQPDGSTKDKKESLWGYGSGVAAATVPEYGDVVLAEYTQPFNEADVTYYRPLYHQTVASLNRFPLYTTGDAAFDAWYVYDDMARHGGIAAIPLNQHGHPTFTRDTDGVPLCPIGLRMQPKFQFDHTNGYKAQRYCCPLLHPERTGETCDHEQFKKGKGCVKDINIEAGGIMRVTLDRQSPLYKVIYNQRTCCERINSQAKELGIERPKVRNIHSVRNLNTLIYLVINVRALKRAKSINKELLPMN